MPSLLTTPTAMLVTLVLVRLTLLLSVAWICHFVLRRKNSRWSLSLWRATIVGALVIVVSSALLPGWGPRLWIRAPEPGFTAAVPLPQMIRPTIPSATQSPTSSIDAPAERSPAMPEKKKLNSWNRYAEAEAGVGAFLDTHIARIAAVLIKLYFLVMALLLFRLFAEVLLMRRMLARADDAEGRVADQARKIARSLELRPMPEVKVSSETTIPLATGLRHPVIVIPETCSRSLSDEDFRFVLLHECSHFKGHDMIWSLAARLMRIFLWPHPLSWGVPAAHRYACDLRCDATAAGKDRADYCTMLAEMALSVSRRVSSPAAMAFLRPGEVLRRIKRIELGVDVGHTSAFRRGLFWLGTVVTLCVISTLGVNAAFPVNQEALEYVKVRVVDPDGEGVESAEIFVYGLRTRKEPASAHGNPGAEPQLTDAAGNAPVAYPRYVYEAMETGQLILTVKHRDFVRYENQGVSVDGPIEITLQPGRHTRITAVNAATGQRITKGLFALLPDDEGAGFQLDKDGVLSSESLDPHRESLLLVGLTDGGPTLFSDLIDLTSYPPGQLSIDNVAMSPGAEWMGQLSDNVGRPVRDGFVALTVAMAPDGDASHDNTIFWSDFVPINEDGNFVFSSVPRNLPIQLSAVCRGYVSVTPPPQEIMDRFSYVATKQHAQAMHDKFVVSQYLGSNPERPIVVEMEPTAVCRVKLVNSDGAALPDVRVHLSPNMAWSPGPGGIVGGYEKTVGMLLRRTEEGRRELEAHRGDYSLSPMRYLATTNSEGMAVINDVPGKKNIGLSVTDQRYELPARGGNPYLRSGQVNFEPGMTTEVTVTAQEKGREILGR